MTAPRLSAPCVTGGRHDLRIDRSRCVKARFRRSSCTKCVDACPRAAITVMAGPEIDEKRCTGCLACTAACPVGSIERSSILPASLSRLTEVKGPILGCINSEIETDALLPCLGGLSDDLLCVLVNVAPGRLRLDASRCESCDNGFIEAPLRARSAQLCDEGLFPKDREPRFLGPGDKVVRQEEGLDRRSFFSSFRKSMLSGAKSVLASLDDKGVADRSYGEKRLPGGRVLLNGIRDKLDIDRAGRFARHFEPRAMFSEACSSCSACVAACPTGALTRIPRAADGSETHAVPGFEARSCVSCGLCVEFCAEKAIAILPLGAGRPGGKAASP